MSYNNRKLGEDLLLQLNSNYDVVNMSRWAYKTYSSNFRILDNSTEEILEYLFRMEDDPQFEYNKKELELLAKLLLQGEKDPIKKINEAK